MTEFRIAKSFILKVASVIILLDLLIVLLLGYDFQSKAFIPERLQRAAIVIGIISLLVFVTIIVMVHILPMLNKRIEKQYHDAIHLYDADLMLLRLRYLRNRRK
ncbi:uncharacterized protein LOC119673534 [Teleopsis dalmanni]|uniref:uncharacterized protein LOC119673534 n=1 Tax=Teleopsis dalmanni TaxID=139649 RepID=UPI0018CEA6EE|nr:uncharacterized protein LOC119673534 [Teleopsis dalmanni]